MPCVHTKQWNTRCYILKVKVNRQKSLIKSDAACEKCRVMQDKSVERAEHQANLVCVFEGAAMWRMVARHWVGGGAYSHQRKQFALRDRHGQQEKMSRLVWE